MDAPREEGARSIIAETTLQPAMKRRIVTAFLLTLSPIWAAAQAVPLREPASATLLEHFYRQITDWDRGGNGTLGSRAFADHDFLTKTRPQLQQLGTAAYPLAPKVAELMRNSKKNTYSLAFVLIGMTPSPEDSAVPGLIAAATGKGAEALMSIAQLGRAASVAAAQALHAESRSDDRPSRLMALVALGYLGKAQPDAATTALIAALSSDDVDSRAAAANSLRSIGARSSAAAPQLIAWLKTRENPYMAVNALAAYPLDAVRPAKAELEAFVGEAKYTAHQKATAVDLLVRLELAQ